MRVGIRTPDTVQILSGIAPTDNVVSEGGYGLDDGTKVKIGKPGEDDGDKGIPDKKEDADKPAADKAEDKD